MMWFEKGLMNSYVQNSRPVIRLFQYLKTVNKVWQYLDDWTWEVIVHTALRQEKAIRVGLSNFVRCVIENLAGGHLYPDGRPLIDPCLDPKTDMLTVLTNEQRLEITQTASDYIKSIAFSEKGWEELFGGPLPEVPKPNPQESQDQPTDGGSSSDTITNTTVTTENATLQFSGEEKVQGGPQAEEKIKQEPQQQPDNANAQNS